MRKWNAAFHATKRLDRPEIAGVGKTRNETKQNGSHTHNNCKFLGASQRASEHCSSYISYPELIYILQYCQVRLYIVYFYCYDTWRGRRESSLGTRPIFRGSGSETSGKAGCLASLRPVLAVLFCWQTSAYGLFSFSYTKWLLHNLRVSLVNRWPMALLLMYSTRT